MNYLDEPNVITSILIGARQEGQNERVGEGAVMMEAEVRVMLLLERAMNQERR